MLIRNSARRQRDMRPISRLPVASRSNRVDYMNLRFVEALPPEIAYLLLAYHLRGVRGISHDRII